MNNIYWTLYIHKHFLGLVARVPGYKSRALGSIPGATRFSEQWVWNGASTIEELLERKK
jgi:hypothetical protein